MTRILVVDDDPELLDALGLALRTSGYDVEVAKNGQQAMRHATQGSPVDLVLTDIVMPEKEGLQLIVELRRARPALKIIAMSGGGTYGNDTYLNYARVLGAHATLPKPFPADTLLRAVADVLSG